MNTKTRKRLLSDFESLGDGLKVALAGIDSPLKLGLAALMLAKDRMKIQWLSSADISKALERAGIAVTPERLEKALARADDRVSRKRVRDEGSYSLMTKGRMGVESLLEVGKISVSYLEGGRPRTARRELREILGGIRGVVRICDPYYGIRTLDALEMLHEDCEVRFLTSRTTENPARLQGPLKDFRRERPKAELRTCADPAALHDRYVLSNSALLLVGNGLKDLGGKESFVVTIPRELAPDLLGEVGEAFDRRWDKASPIS